MNNTSIAVKRIAVTGSPIITIRRIPRVRVESYTQGRLSVLKATYRAIDKLLSRQKYLSLD